MPEYLWVFNAPFGVFKVSSELVLVHFRVLWSLKPACLASSGFDIVASVEIRFDLKSFLSLGSLCLEEARGTQTCDSNRLEGQQIIGYPDIFSPCAVAAIDGLKVVPQTPLSHGGAAQP